ncbi:MAG: glycosyltransferase family 2 protein [Candidatus Wallbacteria bacterium]|nr:glycosyltransferase family 2 protein [Candidatus Wallbacteria bacterium]
MGASSVSVVIPARNAARFLPDCLASVRAQTRQPDDIVAIDDGSTDGTAALLAAAGIRTLALPGHGAGAARNAGVRAASGDWIAFLDADDRWEPSKLEKQLAQAERSPGAVMLFTDALFAGAASGRYLDGRVPARVSSETLLLDNYVCTSTVLARRERLLALGGFRVDLVVAHDYDLWLRLLASERAEYLDEPLSVYSVHDRGVSRDLELATTETLRVVREHGPPAPSGDLRSRLAVLERFLGHLALERDDCASALSHFSSALDLAPGAPLTWAYFLACRAGPRVARLLKSLSLWRRAQFVAGLQPSGRYPGRSA